jgi:arsenite-transporting ATPase
MLSFQAFADPSLKLLFVGGKGGVGKTTFASCVALHLAETYHFKTLIISTDPAHSLADSLMQPIGNRITAIRNAENIFALELNAQQALIDFISQYEPEIRKMIDTSSYLDSEDVDSMIHLPVPGMDEVMGLKTISDLVSKEEFDKYIIDTAPTGHALRLVMMPETLDNWIKTLAKMRWKYRTVMQTFSGKYMPDAADELLLELKKTVKRIEQLLKDHQRCEFVPVVIPADMAIAETGRLIETLVKYGMIVKHLVINNVLAGQSSDPFFMEKQTEQQTYMATIERQFPALEKAVIALQPHEIHGLERLRNLTMQPIDVTVNV